MARLLTPLLALLSSAAALWFFPELVAWLAALGFLSLLTLIVIELGAHHGRRLPSLNEIWRYELAHARVREEVDDTLAVLARDLGRTAEAEVAHIRAEAARSRAKELETAMNPAAVVVRKDQEWRW
jgi:hypothetical protein